MTLSTRETLGDYAAWNYFQSLDRPKNHIFMEKFRHPYGSQRVTADPMEASYLGIHLWAQAVEEAGTRDTSAVREALRRQKFDAPSGPVRIDSENQRTWKTVRLGKIVEGGQFEIVWSSEKPIRPEPYPRSRPTGAWDEFLAGLQTVARALDQASKLKSNDKWREIALPPHRPHWTFTNPRQEPIVLALPAAEVGTFSTITTRGTQA